MIKRVAYFKKGKKDEKIIKFAEQCTKGRDGTCMFMSSPLDFARNRDAKIDLAQFAADSDLIASLRVGKLRGKVVPLDSMFGGAVPDPLN